MEQSFLTSLWFIFSNQPAKIQKNSDRANIIFWIHFTWTLFLIVSCMAVILFYQNFFWIYIGVCIISIFIPRIYKECPLSIWQWRCEGIQLSEATRKERLSFTQMAIKRFFHKEIALRKIQMGHFVVYSVTGILTFYLNGFILPPLPF